jgi:hypothetical protein
MAGLKRQLENSIKTFSILDINDSEKKENGRGERI